MSRFILLIAVVLLWGCDNAKPLKPSGKEVQVALVAPLSGKHMSYGVQGVRGFKAAQRMLPLLSNGDRIVFELHDDASAIERTRDIVESVNTQSKAALIFSGSDVMLDAGRLLQQRKLPTIAVIATHDDIIESAYVTRLSMSNALEAQITASYIHDELYLKHVGVIYSDTNAYSKGLANDFGAIFSALGGDLRFISSIEAYEAQIKALRVDSIELLFLTIDALQSARLLESLQLDRNRVRLFLSDGILSEMSQVDPKHVRLLEGGLVIEHFADNIKPNRYSKALETFLKEEGHENTAFTKLGFEAYLLLYQALEACPEYASACVNGRLRNAPPFEGIASILHSESGDMQRPVYVNRFEKGSMLPQVKVH